MPSIGSTCPLLAVSCLTVSDCVQFESDFHLLELILLAEASKHKPLINAFQVKCRSQQRKQAKKVRKLDLEKAVGSHKAVCNRAVVAERTFIYLCSKLWPALEQQHPTFRHFVPLKNTVATALWKLATGSDYRSVGQLFGVSIMTTCICAQEFCAAGETLLVPEQVRLPLCVGAIIVNIGKGLCWNVLAGLGILHTAKVLRLSTQNIGTVTPSYYTLDDSMCNENVCSPRVVVENAFGWLKGRWKMDSDVQLVRITALTFLPQENQQQVTRPETGD
uniref:DDE Tnp4 domain-containing protein n=1 Tax=Xiphophorus couchianus TaxID=32473 RepID=A0A3B5MBX2_9TELE